MPAGAITAFGQDAFDDNCFRGGVDGQRDQCDDPGVERAALEDLYMVSHDTPAHSAVSCCNEE